MTALADRNWRLIRDEPRDGATQMALEEIAARAALEDDVRTVRTYAWEPSTLSLGYRQDAETVDWEFCEREGIDVTRRQTGGGGIYHDRHADISYTIVAPADEVPGDLMDCYELFCEPILEAFDRLASTPPSRRPSRTPSTGRRAIYGISIRPTTSSRRQTRGRTPRRSAATPVPPARRGHPARLDQLRPRAAETRRRLRGRSRGGDVHGSGHLSPRRGGVRPRGSSRDDRRSAAGLVCCGRIDVAGR